MYVSCTVGPLWTFFKANTGQNVIILYRVIGKHQGSQMHISGLRVQINTDSIVKL